MVLVKLATLCIILISVNLIFAFDNEFLLSTESLPDDLNFMPTLGNGHLGYTVFGNAIYMNGIYNGNGGNSRRARIPNWLNLSVNVILDDDSSKYDNILNEMNLYDGYFRSLKNMPALGLKLEQRTFAHRYYNRALIYELLVQRTETKVPLKFKLTQSPGNASDAFIFSPLSVGGVNNNTKESSNQKSEWKVLKGVTRLKENESFQKQLKTIFIILSEDLENGKILEMTADQRELYYRFVLTADENEHVACLEMKTVLDTKPSQIISTHTQKWHEFWQSFHIKIKNNTELSQVINAGIFYLASSLPSTDSFQKNEKFYGLSPTGLGRGELDDDYEGHNFWDTEIWMFPVVTQFSHQWSRELLLYRELCLPGAKHNANITGYKGARYPWESAFTGTEVINPCCQIVATNQVHITADIALAFQNFFATTNDANFLCENAWPVLREISEFLVDRTEWNAVTQKYHIKNVMGPDEDHENVTDSVYTNLSFKIALEFARFVEKTCHNETTHYQWQDVAEKLFVPFDTKLNYHPQYVGYKIGEEVKQADTILLGYPLQYEMNSTTHHNDLINYENVTRKSGPAMTWSMFSINFLDANEIAKANLYFSKSYNAYVREEFKVWSEVPRGYHGAANFLTGIGGFLQAVINGYSGVRFTHKETESVLEIKTRTALPNTNGFEVHGIYFAGSLFDLDIEVNGQTHITCSFFGDKKLELLKGIEKYEIFKGFSIHLGNETVWIHTVS